MNDTPQGLYAANLRQNRGYPLRWPQPSNKDDPEGLRIGDVGHVNKYGEFKVLRNICFSPQGSVSPFQPILLSKEVARDAVEPVESARIHHTFMPERVIAQDLSYGAGYRFIVKSQSGAILFLPSGAKLYELRGQQQLDEFRDFAMKHARTLCNDAGQESLYLITGLYKTQSWALGSFSGCTENQDFVVKEFVPDNDQVSSDDPAYDYASSFSMDFCSCLKNNKHENQTVLIKGFKITTRSWTKEAVVSVECVDGQQNILLSYLARLLEYFVRQFKFDTPLEWLPGFTVKYYPELSQPPHYLDTINRYLLDQDSTAEVAVTHDDVWIKMLEESESDAMEESDLIRRLKSDYTTVSRSANKAVYLQGKKMEAKSAHQKSRSSSLESTFVAGSSQIVITHIRAEDVTVGLGGVFVGFFVRINADGSTSKRTKIKSALVHDRVIEWDDRIHLPSDQSTEVRIDICVSFETSPMLGTGQPLATLKARVRDLLDRSAAFTSSEMEGAMSPSLSLLVCVQQQYYNYCTSDQADGILNQEESSVPAGVTVAIDEGQRLLVRYLKEHGVANLEGSVGHFRRVLSDCSAKDPYRAATLSNLAEVEFLLYKSLGVASDFTNFILHYREALELLQIDHPDRSMTSLKLSQALLYHCCALGDEEYTEEMCKLVDGLGSTCHEGTREHRAANLILQRYQCFELEDSDDLEALDQFILELRLTAYEPPDKYFDKPARYCNLGLTLRKRFQLSHDAADPDHDAAGYLDQAIECFKKAQRISPDGHLDKPGYMSHLGSALLARFQLQHAVPSVTRPTIAQSDLLRMETTLSSLPITTPSFTHLDDLTDLNESISLCQDAVDRTPDGNLGKPDWLSNLGNALLTRFECLGELEDLQKSIFAQEKAVQLATAQHRKRSAWLQSFGCSLFSRFEYLGNLDDLSKAISVQNEAVRVIPNSYRNRSIYLVHLGRWLIRRFECLDCSDDLNKAISAQVEALQLVLVNHRDKLTQLVDLGNLLFGHFKHLGDREDLDRLISVFEDVVHLIPDTCPDKPISLNKLGTLLFHRFECLGHVVDVDKSISAFERALYLLIGSLDKPGSLVPNDVVTSRARAMLIRHSPNRVLDSAGKMSDQPVNSHRKRPNQPEHTIHVALVGVTGVGKSTLVNVLKGIEIAEVNNNIRPCTTKATRYEMVEGDTRYCIWDTRGLNEGAEPAGLSTRLLRMAGIIPDADRDLKNFLRGRNPRINLALLCIDAKKIRVHVHWKIYNKIWANFGERRLKVALVVTQLGEGDLRSSQWKTTCRTAARDVVEEFPDATLMEGVPKFNELNETQVRACKSRIFSLISGACRR